MPAVGDQPESAAGTQIAIGSAVALVVCRVRHRRRAERGEFHAGGGNERDHPANLTVGAITSASSTTVPAGSVISQNPAAGRRLPSAAVQLAIGSVRQSFSAPRRDRDTVALIA